MKANQCISKYYLKSAGYLLGKNTNKNLSDSIFGITYQTWEDMRKRNEAPLEYESDHSYCDLDNFTFPKSYCTNKLKKG